MDLSVYDAPSPTANTIILHSLVLLSMLSVTLLCLSLLLLHPTTISLDHVVCSSENTEGSQCPYCCLSYYNHVNHPKAATSTQPCIDYAPTKAQIIITEMCKGEPDRDATPSRPRRANPPRPRYEAGSGMARALAIHMTPVGNNRRRPQPRNEGIDPSRR